ncbi:MarR family transcriptional regulator [Myxococcaceae bacterium JPH2]|nr:MarR family transcriptional regulator [Myxococcaceae bacterium JPH2]
MKKDEEERPGPGREGGSTAFLLAQIGAHAASRFAENLGPTGLSPPQVGILRALGHGAGSSQHALAKRLSILPSRMVLLVDELEGRGLVERRDNPEDRRLYELHLSPRGRQTLESVGRIARAHDEAVCAALDERERGQLRALLLRIAEHQGLTPGVHPGMRHVGKTASGAPPLPSGGKGRRPKKGTP